MTAASSVQSCRPADHCTDDAVQSYHGCCMACRSPTTQPLLALRLILHLLLCCHAVPVQIAEISVNKQLETVQKITFDDFFSYDAAIKVR